MSGWGQMELEVGERRWKRKEERSYHDRYNAYISTEESD